jgi:hypothetical protein
MNANFSNIFAGFIIRLGQTRRISLGLRLLMLGLILFINLEQNWSPGQAAITLRSFAAVAGDRHVLITWETATEIDTAGFFLQRSTLQSSGYERISDFFASEGDQLSGAKYKFDDQNVVNDVTYFYKLEIVDTSNRSEFAGPISAKPQTPTLTPTVTQTGETSATPSITVTPSPTTSARVTATRTPTSTRAPTRIPTDTLIPSITNTPEATSTLTFTPTDTATATLLPLPSLSLIYPSPTATMRPTPTPVPVVTEAASGNSGSAGQNDLLRIGLITSIALLWVLLLGWLYIFFYRGRF